MEAVYFFDKNFEKLNHSEKALSKGEYENCIFSRCDFSEADLSGFQFSNCEFNGCNLSMAKLTKTALRELRFINCKLLGLQFGQCNPFGLSFYFEGCLLDHSSFYQIKIKETVFKDSRLHEADLSECDLSGAVFDNCNLHLATFDQSILEGVDFRNAYNYIIDPENNRIKRAKFSTQGLSGLLSKYDIEIEN